MSNMNIEIWAIDSLDSDIQPSVPGLDRLAREIDELGFRVPVIARANGEVIFGHERIAAARRVGIVDIPVLPADRMTEDQLRSFTFFFDVIGSGPRCIEV